MAGAPEVVRVGSDDRVWTLIRHDGHTRLARLQGRTLRELPLGGIEPTELVAGYGRMAPYLAYSAGRIVGALRRDGSERGHTVVPGRPATSLSTASERSGSRTARAPRSARGTGAG